MTNLQVQIGQRLKAIRKLLGYTIKSLSEATSVSSNLISLMENGRIDPSIIKIAKICEFYDITVDALVFDTGKQFEDLLNDLRGVAYDVRGVG